MCFYKNENQRKSIIACSSTDSGTGVSGLLTGEVSEITTGVSKIDKRGSQTKILSNYSIFLKISSGVGPEKPRLSHCQL